MIDDFRQAALDYHLYPQPGKFGIQTTKRMETQRDLALAYSPGVAAPCEVIVDDPTAARLYTARGNLVVLSQTFDFLCARDMSALSGSWQRAVGVIEFKGVHYPKSVILHAVFFYLRYAVSYRDLEEIMAERGVKVDHATLNRWVVKFAPLIAAWAQARKRPTATSWRMDETYIRVKGKWTYLYRAVDRDGKTLDFLLSKRRDLSAARRFFKRAIGTNGVPDRIVIDKSGANLLTILGRRLRDPL